MSFRCILRRLVQPLAFAILVSLSTSLVAEDTWKNVKIPEVFKKPPAGIDGMSIYRGFVQVPAEWRGKNLEIFVEPSDWAHEVYFNGQLIGSAGTFPPFFRSALGANDRFFVSADKVQYDRPNCIALRICDNDGRSGFNIAAPVVFAGEHAIRLAGDWQHRAGGDAALTKFDDAKEPKGTTLFARLDNAVEVAATLKKLQDEIGPLAPIDALKHFTVPDDLELQLAVAEPEVRQPLSIKWDERGRLWVVQFIQYPDPAGLKMLSRDKFLRSVYDKVPPAPPNHFRGADKITIHEDTDGDGKYDKHKTFVEGLSLVSSVAIGRGGVWVLNPPYLLFYPDKNRDDVPDGDPEVHLEGFGIEDSHSIANSMRWGPDGWLYATQGSTVTGDVKRPQDKTPVHSLGQNVWRYHPELRKYEIFAEGGGNAFGVEIDQKGRIFSGTNGGNTRGYHYVQGGYFRKGFEKHGALSNPYSFGYFEQMAHHQVPRFTHTFVIYDGGALPKQYNGNLFGVGPLQSHVVRAEITPDGSTFKCRDLDHPITTKDSWCRPVDIQVGPDGAIYVVDLYEQRIDHASHYQGRIDRERGRVWRLQAKGAKPIQPFDLAKQSTDELIAHLSHSNKWFRQTALKVLADRDRDPALAAKLVAAASERNDQTALELVWAAYQLGGLDESTTLKLLDHPNPHVRAWTVRLAADDSEVTSELAKKFETLAEREPNVEVRSQLAASAKRLPTADALPVVRQLLARDEDAKDLHVPLLVWWAVESKAATDRDPIVSLLRDRDLWQRPMVKDHFLERLMRRYASAGTRKDLLVCATLLDQSPDSATAEILLKGFEKAFEGRPLVGLPDELVAALGKVGGGSLALRLRQGDAAAVSESLQAVANRKAKKAERIQYIQILSEIGQKPAVPVLLTLAGSDDDGDVRAAAVSNLQSFDDPQIGRQIVHLYKSLPNELQEVAHSLLSSRKTWAKTLLEAIDAGQIEPKAIPQDIIRKILFHRDEQIAGLVKKHYGEIQGATSAELHATIERYKAAVAAGSGNPYAGKKLYMANCGKCHVLFNEGGRIGPDLTSFKRDDLHTMLVNVVNPSAQIREGYENYVMVTSDGRTLNGFIADQDTRVVVMRGVDGQSTIVPRTEIDDLAAIPRSIMPEGILKDYNEQQVRDLFAYLRATQPLAAGR